jgi:hypothetical protein
MSASLTELMSQLQAGQVLEITVWKDDADEEGATFQAVIEQKFTDGKMLLVPSNVHFEKHCGILKPPVVIGALYGETAVPCMFYPVLQSVERGSKKGFWIELPKDMEVETIQRRAFARINARVPVVIESELEMPAYTVDISGGGCQFASAKQFNAGSILHLHLQFQPNGEAIVLKGKVVISRENIRSRQLEDAFSTAIQFMDVSDAVQQRLMGECFRIELNQKRHLQK